MLARSRLGLLLRRWVSGVRWRTLVTAIACVALFGLVSATFFSYAPAGDGPADIDAMIPANRLSKAVVELRVRPTSPWEPEDDRLRVCYRIPGIAPTGGIETWLWTGLERGVLTNERMRVHAVNLERPAWRREIFWSSDSLSRLFADNVLLEMPPQQLWDECDVILNTCVTPPVQTSEHNAVSIVVVHGGNDSWTGMYTRYLSQYDGAVCVSKFCLDVVNPLASQSGVPLALIPSALDVPRYASPTVPRAALHAEWGVPRGTRFVLGFFARISPEKNPPYFIEVARRMPDGWFAVIAGPLYQRHTLASMTERDKRRMRVIGNEPDSISFYHAVDALLLPSADEGGPITLLEAWAARKPMYMRETGLALQHPAASFLLLDDSLSDPAMTAAQIHGDTLALASTASSPLRDRALARLTEGERVVNQHFSLQAVARGWQNFIDEARRGLEARSRTARLLFKCIQLPVGNTEDSLDDDRAQLRRHGRTCALYCHVGGPGCKARMPLWDRASRYPVLVAEAVSIGVDIGVSRYTGTMGTVQEGRMPGQLQLECDDKRVFAAELPEFGRVSRDIVLASRAANGAFSVREALSRCDAVSLVVEGRAGHVTQLFDVSIVW